MERDPGKIQDLEDICITHFILEGDPQDIKILHRVLGLDGKKRDMLFTHDGVQVGPRRIYPLTVHIRHLIEHIVKDLDPQMGHADIIYVREAHGKPDIHFFRVFIYHVYLASDIAGGLLNTQKSFVI